MAPNTALPMMQQTVWDARLPIEIRLAPSECRVFDKADAYLVSFAISPTAKLRKDLGCVASDLLLAFAPAPTSCVLLALSHSGSGLRGN